MIPRVGPGGNSFKGAGLYYLHDKGAASSERVAFTQTMNMHTDDAEKALKVMAWTAAHQRELKEAAGVKATGRKLEKPVYTYSLSWAQDETPSQRHMVEAMTESLGVLGLSSHETLLVIHDDTAHKHIHAIVNRVDPKTGKAAKMSKDHLKLSKWAEGYERAQGKIRVERRVNHNARRAMGKFVKNTNLSRQEYDWLKAQARRDPDTLRKARQERQEKDLAALTARLAQRRDRFEAGLSRRFDRPSQKLAAQISGLEEKIGRPGFFRALVRKITGREKRDHSLLAQLKGSSRAIDDRIKTVRGAFRGQIGLEWEKLELRHAAEKARDEALIARARGEGDRGRAEERMRKNFQVRSGKETARHSPAPVSERPALSETQRGAAQKPPETSRQVAPKSPDTPREPRKTPSAEVLAKRNEVAKERRKRDRQRNRNRDRDGGRTRGMDD